jgi:DNA-binding transcriptional MocR family regulator
VPASVEHAAAAGVKALFLQPRAQNPTGAAVTQERAARLSGLLTGADVVLVENDSAGAIASEPLVTLATWFPGRTLHIRSFSKSHGPDLRLAAVAGPRTLVDPMVERRRLGQMWTSRLLQRLLLDLLTRPASVAQVDVARAEYARRRSLLVQALAARGIAVGGKDGVNLWLPVADEAAALLRLASRNIGVAAGAPFCVGPSAAAHVRVTCGLLADRHTEIAAELAMASARHTMTPPR